MEQQSSNNSEGSEEEVVPRKWDKNGKPRRNLSKYERSQNPTESPFLDWICCRLNRQFKENRSDQKKDEKLKKKKNKIPVKRVEYLWKIARKYDKQLRAQSRQQKKLDQMLRNNVIDDINDELDLENQQEQSGQNLQWYLLDSNGTFVFIWNFGITILTIYTLIVAPFM